MLAECNIQPSKRLGQSFLADANILRKIIAAADIAPDDRIFEVGPGVGALTGALAFTAQEVVALELDRRLVELLTNTLRDTPRVRIIQGDILKADLRALLGDGPWKLLANLPYSIVGPAIARLVAHRQLFALMVLMVQREVAQRLAASPSIKQYGVLSVLVQAHMQVDIVGQVSRTCFYPQPQVDSALVRLAPRSQSAVEEGIEPAFIAVVRAVFRQRRKTIQNALAVAAELKLTREDAARLLQAADIDAGLRPAALSPEEFATIARALQRRQDNVRI